MLLLRTLAQPILDKVGLTDAHVEVRNKALTVVGECGQKIMQAKGIQFSKSTINGKERDIAIELFTKLIDKSKTKIIAFVEAYKIHAKLPNDTIKERENICLKYGFKIVPNYRNSEVIFKTDDNISINIKQLGEINIADGKDVASIIKALNMSKKCIDEISISFTRLNIREDSECNIQKLKADLNNCSI